MSNPVDVVDDTSAATGDDIIMTAADTVDVSPNGVTPVTFTLSDVRPLPIAAAMVCAKVYT